MDSQTKQSNNYVTEKKYKLSFFGNNPRTDWAIIVTVGFVLLISFSILFYLESSDIKNSISENIPASEDKTYFDIEKAKTLLRNFQGEGLNVIDQSL